MKRKTLRFIPCILVVAVLIVVFIASGYKKDIGDCVEYKCDVKVLSLSTNIEISKNGNKFATVSGDILKFITDPLTMYDTVGNKIAYAGDDYHLISQDSHSIYVNDVVTAEMVGLVDILGETYDIYNSDGEEIANVSFNALNTNGKMYDNDGNLIADFNSKLFFRDFTVRITNNCPLDEETVLMIFCSYYSDQAADSK